MSDAQPLAIDDSPLFDAVLAPNRSLGETGFRVLMAAFAAASVAVSIPFWLLGAWPVIGFLGLDVALLYGLFRLNYRDAAAREHVTVTPLSFVLTRVDPKGRRRQWLFNPLWVRLKRGVQDEFGLRRLSVQHRGEEYELARCLGAFEKAAFADALAAALASARRGLSRT